MLLTIVSIIVYSLLIGVLVSAPMGPAGILCLSRTLHRSRRAGLLTGVGIMLSDVIYAIISFLGNGLLLDFLERNELIFRFIGSLLLLGFALLIYFHPPRLKVKKEDITEKITPWQLVATALGLTFASNPLIIFVYIALYSRFGLVPQEGQFLLYFLLTIFFIGIGAMLWWIGLTRFVNSFRNRSSITSLKIFNRIIAIVFMMISIIGIITIIWPIDIG